MLRDTTSRGLYVRFWPPHTSERRGGGGGCEQEGCMFITIGPMKKLRRQTLVQPVATFETQLPQRVQDGPGAPRSVLGRTERPPHAVLGPVYT